MTTEALAGSHDEAWFSARARAGIGGLRAYDPGHDIVALRRAHGPALVELGSNENPFGAAPGVRAAVLGCLDTLHRYPDPRGGGLKRALADVHGVDEAGLLLGNGSHELLMQLAQAFAGPGDEVLMSRHGFAVYAIAARAAGAALVVAAANPADDTMPLGHDLEAIAGAITAATRLVYLTNPSNPTGTWFGGGALARFLARVPDDVLVVVDEAYAEYVDAPDFRSALSLRSAHPNLVVTRTFSKAYGLAGLRIGYLVAAAGLVAVMERLRESFNVTVPSLAAAQAALADGAHLRHVVAATAAQRRVLAGELEARGCTVLPSQTNFLLVRPAADAATVEQRLLQRGVVVRPMGGYGLPDYLRITVGREQDNVRLLQAFDGVSQ